MPHERTGAFPFGAAFRYVSYEKRPVEPAFLNAKLFFISSRASGAEKHCNEVILEEADETPVDAADDGEDQRDPVNNGESSHRREMGEGG